MEALPHYIGSAQPGPGASRSPECSKYIEYAKGLAGAGNAFLATMHMYSHSEGGRPTDEGGGREERFTTASCDAAASFRGT